LAVLFAAMPKCHRSTVGEDRAQRPDCHDKRSAWRVINDRTVSVSYAGWSAL